MARAGRSAPRSARSRAAARHALGQQAEALAASYLLGRGFTIVGRNVRVAGGELDVIARAGGLLVFCEVRARRQASWVAPTDTLDAGKQQRVKRAASSWLAAHEAPWAREVRFDVAAVTFERPEGELRYYEGAFE